MYVGGHTPPAPVDIVEIASVAQAKSLFIFSMDLEDPQTVQKTAWYAWPCRVENSFQGAMSKAELRSFLVLLFVTGMCLGWLIDDFFLWKVSA